MNSHGTRTVTSKPRTTLIYVVLTVLLLCQYCSCQTYTTTPNRTVFVQEACEGIDRAELSSQQTQNNYESLRSYLTWYYNFEGNNLFRVIIDGNADRSLQEWQSSNSAGWIISYIAFLAGLVVTILIWPFLICCMCNCCCCCRPCCHPPSADQEGYTSCETCWPGVVVIVLLLIVIAGGIVGMVLLAEDAEPSVQRLECTTHIFTDDIINGNVTADGSNYFAGVQTFSDELLTFQNSLTDINNNLDQVKSTSTNIMNLESQMNTAKTDTGNIPNGAGGMLSLSYDTPFNASASSSTISSIFPAVLGVLGQPASLVGAVEASIDGTKVFVDAMSASADSFLTSITSVNTTIGGIRNDLRNVVNSFNIADRDINRVYDGVEIGFFWLKVALYIYYGLILLFALIVVIGVLAMFCIGPSKCCRCVIYSFCILLWFVAIFTFILAVAMTVAVPFTTLGCNFFQSSLQSETNFKRNFDSLFDGETINYLVTCLPFSNGDLISDIAGTEIVNQLQLLGDVTNNLTEFLNLNASIGINTAFTALTTGIQGTLNTNTLDIVDPTSIAILERISQPTNFGSCSAAGFSSDSFVPSNSQNVVSCKVNGPQADRNTCADRTAFEARNSGCTGCMDSTSFDALLNLNQATLETSFNTRYSGCTTFASEISNVWTNYFAAKRNAMTPVENRRSAVQSGSMSTLTTNIDNTYNPAFLSVRNSIQSIVPRITNPQTGLLAGLNCRLIGEDVILFTNTFCGQALPYFYTLLIVSGVIGFTLLVTMCCVVCFGVRNWRGRSDEYVENQAEKPETANQLRQPEASHQPTNSQGGPALYMAHTTDDQGMVIPVQ